MKGKLIVFEGIDCSGKQTQAELLRKKLKESFNIECHSYSFPRYEEIFGDMIGQWLKKKIELTTMSIQMLHVADRMEAKAEMLKALEDKWIICDRYHLSTVAYGVAENGIQVQLWLQALGTFLLVPDVQFIIDLPVSEAMNRKDEKDRNESDEEKLIKVRNQYLMHGQNNPQTNIMIDGTGTIEEVHEEIFEFIKGTFFAGEE